MFMCKMNLIFVAGIFLIFIGSSYSKGQHKVQCSEEWMKVGIAVPDNYQDSHQIYLEGMKGYPNPNCQPEIKDSLAKFSLSLKDIYECGVTRVVNKLTGKKVFYHKIIVEGDNDYGKEIVSVKCILAGPSYNITNHRHARDVLPAGFSEPEDLEITTSLVERAPEPILSVGVRQGGAIVTGELNVSPGTPLAMEISLDKASSPIYGLGVTYMQVTDTKSQEETIIFNGCSVDPYLFENFNTVDGDFLNAKFRAFKFPESTYVQFRGTVNVCLDKCKGVQCSNGQMGYGRKRRETTTDPNKVYEISTTTFIKVNDDASADKSEVSHLEQNLKQLQIANQKLARNSRGSSFSETDESALIEETSSFKTITVTDDKSDSSKINVKVTLYGFIFSLLFIINLC